MTPWTVACQLPLSVEFSRPVYWSGLPFPLPGVFSNPGIEPICPTLQADSLPSESLGKLKNTGVGSLSILQQIVPAQELNWGLLHCRQILYQLSYQGRLPNPGIEPRSPTLQEDSLAAGPQGKLELLLLLLLSRFSCV